MPALPGDRSSKGIKRNILGGKRGFPWHWHLLHMDHHSLVLRETEVSKDWTTEIRWGGEGGTAEVAALQPPDSVFSWGERKNRGQKWKHKKGPAYRQYAWVSVFFLHAAACLNLRPKLGLDVRLKSRPAQRSTLRLPLHIISSGFLQNEVTQTPKCTSWGVGNETCKK